MAEHAPTPYSAGIAEIRDAKGRTFACLIRYETREERDANSAYIVRACNAHEALLAALQMAHAGLCEASAFIPDSCMGAVASCDRAIAAVNTALQSARGDA